jgi:hypothetical protein
MHVGTIMDSRNTTFLKDIFPMRGNFCSGSQKSLINDEPTDMIEHNEQTLVKILWVTMKLLKRAKDKGQQSHLVMISLCTLWIILVKSLKRHIHLLMWTTRRKQSRVRWIQLCLIELRRLLVDHMDANPLGASDCSRKNLKLMVQLKSIR